MKAKIYNKEVGHYEIYFPPPAYGKKHQEYYIENSAEKITITEIQTVENK